MKCAVLICTRKAEPGITVCAACLDRILRGWAHVHDWQPGPVSPESTALILGCADCGIPKPIRTRVVDGYLICLDCKEPLPNWRTDFAGHWHGVHMCRP